MRIVLIADDTDFEGGYVAERLLARGGVLEYLDRANLPDRTTHLGSERLDLLVLLGSARAAHDPRHVHDVMAESAWVRESLAAGTPVMGICFGAHLMARALGGTSYAMNEPEVGLVRVDTLDPVLCPPGPWAQFHEDTFAPPPSARVIASTWYGPQCFIDDSRGAQAIAWQFHPEVVPEVFERWVNDSDATVRAAGADAELLVREIRRHAPAARNRAFALVDAALDYLNVA